MPGEPATPEVDRSRHHGPPPSDTSSLGSARDTPPQSRARTGPLPPPPAGQQPATPQPPPQSQSQSQQIQQPQQQPNAVQNR